MCGWMDGRINRSIYLWTDGWIDRWVDAGDFLLARSSMSLARLRSLESVELMSAAIEHLVKVSLARNVSTVNRNTILSYLFLVSYCDRYVIPRCQESEFKARLVQRRNFIRAIVVFSCPRPS